MCWFLNLFRVWNENLFAPSCIFTSAGPLIRFSFSPEILLFISLPFAAYFIAPFTRILIFLWECLVCTVCRVQIPAYTCSHDYLARSPFWDKMWHILGFYVGTISAYNRARDKNCAAPSTLGCVCFSMTTDSPSLVQWECVASGRFFPGTGILTGFILPSCVSDRGQSYKWIIRKQKPQLNEEPLNFLHKMCLRKAWICFFSSLLWVKKQGRRDSVKGKFCSRKCRVALPFPPFFKSGFLQRGRDGFSVCFPIRMAIFKTTKKMTPWLAKPAEWT